MTHISNAPLELAPRNDIGAFIYSYVAPAYASINGLIRISFQALGMKPLASFFSAFNHWLQFSADFAHLKRPESGR